MKKLTAAKLQEIKEMRANDLTLQEIAKKLKVHPRTILYHLRRFKVKNIWVRSPGRGPRVIKLSI